MGKVSGEGKIFVAQNRREATKKLMVTRYQRLGTAGTKKELARRGVDHLEQDERDLALADFSQAVELGSRDHYVLYCRALLLLHQGRVDEYREFWSLC